MKRRPRYRDARHPFLVWWRRSAQRVRKKRRPPPNGYAGVRLGPGDAVPVLSSAIEPREFYDRYVATRTPVIVRGGLLRETMATLANDAVLHQVAGECVLNVETREGSESFGRGKKQSMSFSSLLREVSAGSTRHYLTTQELPELASGGEQLVAPPLTELAGCFPLRPPLLPTLVPQSINLWLGRADGSGASSGLHHDYHDNLYCLLKGRKSFRLFSPADAAHLYTHGELLRVHPNGRINYEGHPTAADGRSPDDERREAVQRARREQSEAEQALARAEEAEDNGEPGADEALEAAEQRLEAAMDAVMELEMPAAETARKRRRGQAATDAAAANGADGGDDNSPPPSFSRVVLTAPAAELRARFPRLQHARETRCELRAGDLLYLPCGWFHDVTSYDEHRALNYWFHPPDGESYDDPYSAAEFWEAEFKAASKPQRTMAQSGKKQNAGKKHGRRR